MARSFPAKRACICPIMATSPLFVAALTGLPAKPLDMKKPARKLTHHDFRKRIKRVDSVFYATGQSASLSQSESHPLKSAFKGFGWAYVILLVSQNRPALETLLSERALSAQHQTWVVAAAAVAITVSLIMVAVHLLRALLQKGAQRSNSSGLLVGTGLALALSYTPASVWDAGSELFEGHLRGAVLSANASMDIDVPAVDFSDLVFTSSASR